MNRRSFLALAAGGAAVASATALRSGWSAGPRRNISSATTSVVRSKAGVLELDLVAQETAIRIPGTSGRALTYNGLLPGPQIELQPGDAVRIHLHNRLNQPTNLHYHGLHIPPDGTADNVFLRVAPGQQQSYSFSLPANHPAGLFHYHPHHHGTVADQVFGGLGGALLVRGDLDRNPEVQAAQEEVLVLKDLPAANERSGSGVMLGREGSVLSVNGQVNPELQVAAGGLLRLRLLNASNARFWRLALEGHTMHLIATDGGALEEPVPLQELLLVPGERADVLVQVTPKGGRFRLNRLPYRRLGRPGMGGMGMGRAGSSQGQADVIATVTTIGAVAPQPLPQQLLAVEELPSPVRTRRFVMNHGMAPGMGMAFLLNGQSYNHARIDTRVQLGDTEDWELVNTGVMDHPFHLHVNPMQVVSRNDRPEAYRAWRDVVLVRPGETVRVRTRFSDFAGKSVYHCHILDHEELGMMGNILIEG
ncbi:multicopper oxidase family protein [Synechococcus sp. BS55D]|uniref:multicopper oxidase family protein n=1 Tax=Synechococcus sp. BS55D TaxID=2055943 RepID=UPI001039292E|nr:multicopper oxidase family protein [Synechococcus sp. BS55D]TCD55265.1 copper oxidase [Synechococcus sp. BS55D]